MLPDGLKYSNNHIWVRLKGEKAVIGITEYLADGIHSLDAVSLPQRGEEVEQDEIFGSIETTQNSVDLISPLSGEVLKVNTLLREEPEILINDPYGDGWLIEIELYDEEEVDALLKSEEYER